LLGKFRVAAAANRLASSAKGQRFGVATRDTQACRGEILLHLKQKLPRLMPRQFLWQGQ